MRPSKPKTAWERLQEDATHFLQLISNGKTIRDALKKAHGNPYEAHMVCAVCGFKAGMDLGYLIGRLRENKQVALSAPCTAEGCTGHASYHGIE